MEVINTILNQILTPSILFFALGVLAVLLKSDLKVPKAMSDAMMLFLLCAIGLEGGIGISKAGIGVVLLPAIAAVFIGVAVVITSYFILIMLKFDIVNAGTIAGHYGAVGAATMIMGLAYLEEFHVSYEAFIPALYPLMDSPAVITAIILTSFELERQKKSGEKIQIIKIIKESIVGKAVLVMLACMIIGYVNGKEGTAEIMPFFDGMFMGVLCLFMLDMGLLAGEGLHEWKNVGIPLTAFAIIKPAINGLIGVFIGDLVGLSIGGATLLGAISMSSSFISAPVAMRAAFPQANISLSLTASVAITFPFSALIGIPLCYEFAKILG